MSKRTNQSTWFLLWMLIPLQPFRSFRSWAFVVLLGLIFSTNLTAQCTLICRSSLNLSLSASGKSVITPQILLANPACNPADYYVQITDSQGNMIGDTITCQEVGQTLTAGVYHNITGAFCTTAIQVSEVIPPQITVADTLISCILDYSITAIGIPQVSDNCGIASFQHNDNFIAKDCFSTNSNGDTITAHIVRTWTATDVNNNVSTSIQNIYLKRATVDQVVFPSNKDDIVDPALDCSADPLDLILTGEPTIDGRPLMTEGHCELVGSFTDQPLDICGPGSYRILRTWKAIDYCTGAFREHIQIIKIVDTTAPIITCPTDIQLPTDTYSCNATVNLPSATATDDCSAVTITPSWAYGSGYGPFQNIPLGDHIVTYTASDACGNTATCTALLTITDQIIPAMVCEGNMQVSLVNNGEAWIAAFAFDDGSYDNCAIDLFEVSRDGAPFAPSVRFDCYDVQQPVLITLRAYDLAGNFNSCDILVDVADPIQPLISCPSAITLECTDDAQNLAITGIPTTVDACGIDTVFYSDNLQLNTCGVGNIFRLWTVRDVNNNVRTCLQTITVEDNSVLNISFPANYQTTECDPLLDPTITGEPIITGYNCEDLNVFYIDFELPIAPPACFQILREWTVINWCVYDPNSGTDEGLYTYTQVLTVSDDIVPQLQCFSDTIFGAYSTNCEASFIQLPIATATDCSDTITITNNSPYADQSGADASGDYPIGIHIVEFTAHDGCGNYSTCTVSITVVDAQIPNASCLGSLTVSLSSEGYAVITPEMLDSGSIDNCTTISNLYKTINRDTFFCSDLGSQEVILTVTDEQGNSDFCTILVEVQDNNNICSSALYYLSGIIRKENGMPLSNTVVYLTGDQLDSTLTDEQGSYLFAAVEAGGDYVVSPFNNNEITNGVTTYDLILLGQQILGISNLNSPYRKIAADVNDSRSLSALDMISIRKSILLIDTLFSSVHSWKFIDANHVFSPVGNPLYENYNEYLVVENLSTDLDTLDFIGVKMGDLNDNSSGSNLQSAGDTRSEGNPVELYTDELILQPGNKYRIPISSGKWEDIMGLQMTLSLDETLVLHEIEIAEGSGLTNLTLDHFGAYRNNEKFIAMSWVHPEGAGTIDQEVLFYLNISTTTRQPLSKAFGLTNSLLKSEIYGEFGSETIQSVDLRLEFEEKTAISIDHSSKYHVFAYPNPVVEGTTLRLEGTTGDHLEVELWVYNEMGRKIMNQRIMMGVEETEIFLSRAQLGSQSGIRYYRVVTLDQRIMAKGKLVLVD